MKTDTKWLLGGLVLAGSALMLASRATSSTIIDRREEAWKKLKDEPKSHTTNRPLEDVYAVVLHQMGFNRGSQIDKYDGVVAQYVILEDGAIVQLHDHTKRLPAAVGLNEGSISIEFAGNFPSRARSTKSKHFYRPDKFGKHQLTKAQISAGRWLLDRFNREGWLTHVLAHRQGGPERQNDPGPDVWRQVGAWAVNQMGLDWGGPSFAVSGGEPIPDRWWGATAA